MDGIITLALILTPMFVGFFLPVNGKLARFGEKVLTLIVYLILLLIGNELAHLDNFGRIMGQMTLYLSALIPLTLGSGMLALYLYDKVSPCPYYKKTSDNSTQSIDLKGIFVQLSCLFVGFVIGKLTAFELPKNTSTVLLMILLFLVGVLLKNANIPLKQVLINRRGVAISVIFMVVTMLSGVIFSLFFKEVEWSKGVALASSFGWYSLSGTMMTDAYGAMWGSVALINDLTREILALLFIPTVMRWSSSSAIGLAGVTSLDFTLPTLQKAGGSEIVPMVISFGFITNVVSPVLMVIFSKLG